jgi:hypothetical protein
MSDVFILLTTEQNLQTKKKGQATPHHLTLFVEQVALATPHRLSQFFLTVCPPRHKPKEL